MTEDWLCFGNLTIVINLKPVKDTFIPFRFDNWWL